MSTNTDLNLFNIFLQLYGGCATTLNAVEGFALGFFASFAGALRGTILTQLSSNLDLATNHILVSIFGLVYLMFVVVLVIVAYGNVITWGSALIIAVTVFMLFYGLLIFARNNIKTAVQQNSQALLNDLINLFVTAGPPALVTGAAGYVIGLNAAPPNPITCPKFFSGVTGPTGPTGPAAAVLRTFQAAAQSGLCHQLEGCYTDPSLQQQARTLIQNIGPGHYVQPSTSAPEPAPREVIVVAPQAFPQLARDDGYRTIAAKRARSEERGSGGSGVAGCATGNCG